MTNEQDVPAVLGPVERHVGRHLRRHQKLIAAGEATPAKQHLNKPCSDCPTRRDALPGWLGGATPEQYRGLLHSDAPVVCHVHAGSRCAGVSIYRRNVCKWEPEAGRLPADRATVFASPIEFVAHHQSRFVTPNAELTGPKRPARKDEDGTE